MCRLALLLLLVLFVTPVQGDENDELIAKQKMTALKNLKKSDVSMSALVETENLLICGAYPEAKLKTMGEVVQKHYTMAFKALKFEMLESPPKGKLAVYFFPERKQYADFVRDVLNDRIEKDERSHSDARSNEPYVAVTVLPGSKPTDLEIEAAGQTAAALLQAKAGPSVLPAWMKEGFAKAVLMRYDPKSYANERATVRRLLYETKVKPGKYKAADVWSPGGEADKRLLAASLMDYLVFGLESAKFAKILSGLRADEAGANPSFQTALMSADTTVEALDKGWKKWVASGK